MKKFSIVTIVALAVLAMAALPALASKHDGKPGAGGWGIVDGHLEGANPVAGRVCVTAGAWSDCIDITRPDNHGFQILIPKNLVPIATFTAWAGPDLADVYNDQANGEPAFDHHLTNAACENVPVVGSGMALCQDDDQNDVIKRINISWNANATRGNRDTSWRGGPDGDR